MRLSRYLRNRALRWTRRVSSPLRRWRTARTATVLPLGAVRRRLELTIAALYGVQLRVAATGTATDLFVAGSASDWRFELVEPNTIVAKKNADDGGMISTKNVTGFFIGDSKIG